MGDDLLRRVRWGNVARAAIAVGIAAAVVAWPRLAPPPPDVPAPGATPLVGEPAVPRRAGRDGPQSEGGEGRVRRGEGLRSGGGGSRRGQRRLGEGGRDEGGGGAVPRDEGRGGAVARGEGGEGERDGVGGAVPPDDGGGGGGAVPRDGGRGGAPPAVAPPAPDPAQAEFGIEGG